jgi:acyl-CoA synthetase (NDP forming)
MVNGICEVFAGITCDPLFGPAITFGIGGIFIEIMKDAVTEMAPLSRERALSMINGIKAAALLQGARGTAPGDIDALAECLVHVSRFAVGNAGRFRSLDLNPIIVRAAGQGVVAVDIAIEANPGSEATNGAP